MQLTRYEQETVMNFNEGESTASIYTHNKAIIRKLRQLSESRPDDCKLQKTSHQGQAADFLIPKSWIKITPSRIISAEQRTIMAERMKANLSRNSSITIAESNHETATMDKDTTSCAPCCIVCSNYGTSCRGERKAAPVLPHKDGRVNQLRKRSVSHKDFNELKEACQL